MKVLGILAAAIISIFLKAFVTAKLWAWFIVPTFAAPQISLPVAYGISVISVLLTYQRGGKTEEDRKASEILGFAIAAPLVALLFGYIATLFM